MADPIKCPGCGSTIRIDEERAVLYCPYCGAEMAQQEKTIEKALRYRRLTKREKAEMKIRLSEERTKRTEIENRYAVYILAAIAALFLIVYLINLIIK